MEQQKASKIILDNARIKGWELSKEHISWYINLDKYDSNGFEKRENPVMENHSSIYEPKLYLKPKATADINNFLLSDKTGLIIVGESGYGKSCLMLHQFNEFREKGHIAIFLNALNLPSRDFGTTFYDYIKALYGINTIKEFDKILSERNKFCFILIDAIDKYPGNDGPVTLLENIIEFTNNWETPSSIRIIASVRNEIWDYYTDSRKQIKKTNSEVYNFYMINNHPILLDGFKDEGMRKDLYLKYVSTFSLRPNLYSHLDDYYKDLITQPWMMSVIAKTYSNLNRTNTNEIVSIPDKPINLDDLYKAFTERLIDDVVNDSQGVYADNLKRELQECLTTFSELLYENLIYNTTDPSNNAGSLAEDMLNSYPDFRNEYVEKKPNYSDSLLNILIDTRLIEQKSDAEKSYSGTEKDSPKKSYRFFHDQYASFQLGIVVKKELGKVTSTTLMQNQEKRTEIIRKVKKILDNAKNSPILNNVLDNWFYDNIRAEINDTKNDYLLVLFNDLIKSNENRGKLEWTSYESIVKNDYYYFYVGTFLISLIKKTPTTSHDLIKKLFRYPDRQILYCFTDYFLTTFEGILAENSNESAYRQNFLTFIESCDQKKDDFLFRKAGDTFSELFNHKKDVVKPGQSKIIHFFRSAFPSCTIQNFILHKKKIECHLNFLVKFSVKAAISSIGAKDRRLSLFMDFFRDNYSIVLETIDEKYIFNPIKIIIKCNINKKLDKSGEDQWMQAIGDEDTGRGINNYYYVSSPGENTIQQIQRNILDELYTYLVDINNGDFSQLVLNRRSPFKDSFLKAVTFNRSSLVGYVGILLAGMIINNVQDKQEKEALLKKVIDELFERNSAAADFFIPILLDILAKIHGNKDNPKHIEFSKIILGNYLEFLKKLLVNKDRTADIFIFVDTPGLSILDDTNWKNHYEPIFNLIFTEITTEEHFNRFNNNGLNYLCFLPDSKIGDKVIRYFIEKDMHQNEIWRDSILKLLASMYVSNKKVLMDILEYFSSKKDIPDIQTIINKIDKNIFKLKEARSYQTLWNTTFISAFNTNKDLKYYLIRDLFGGLITTNSVQEMAKEYRRFVINFLIHVVKGKPGEFNYYLDKDDALRICRFKSKQGKGERYRSKKQPDQT